MNSRYYLKAFEKEAKEMKKKKEQRLIRTKNAVPMIIDSIVFESNQFFEKDGRKYCVKDIEFKELQSFYYIENTLEQYHFGKYKRKYVITPKQKTLNTYPVCITVISTLELGQYCTNEVKIRTDLLVEKSLDIEATILTSKFGEEKTNISKKDVNVCMNIKEVVLDYLITYSKSTCKASLPELESYTNVSYLRDEIYSVSSKDKIEDIILKNIKKMAYFELKEFIRDTSCLKESTISIFDINAKLRLREYLASVVEYTVDDGKITIEIINKPVMCDLLFIDVYILDKLYKKFAYFEVDNLNGIELNELLSKFDLKD